MLKYPHQLVSSFREGLGLRIEVPGHGEDELGLELELPRHHEEKLHVKPGQLLLGLLAQVEDSRVERLQQSAIILCMMRDMASRWEEKSSRK